MTSLLHLFTPHISASATPGQVTDRNIRLLQFEIAFAAVMGAVVTFHSAFIIRLGGSDALVALLSALPALAAAIFSLPTARFLQTRAKRKPWIFGSLMIVRVGTGLIGVIPLFLQVNTAAFLVAWVVVLQFPAILFTNGFQALLADLIPERRRAAIFARRSIINSIGVVIVSALAGYWLDHVAFPTNYELMYIFAFIATLGSAYFLQQLVVPDRPGMTTLELPKLARADKPPAKVSLRGPLGRMLFNLGVYYFGIYFVSSLFNIYYIEQLKASDLWLGINTAAGSLGVVGGYLVWPRLLRNRQFMWALRRASLLTWTFPVFIALIPNLYFILFVNFMVNMFHPGVELSSLNILMKIGGGETRPVTMSWYNTALFGVAFVSPLLGTLFASLVSIPAALIVSGVLRFAGGLLWEVNPVTEPKEMPLAPAPAK